jgi:hypothetical protein
MVAATGEKSHGPPMEFEAVHRRVETDFRVDLVELVLSGVLRLHCGLEFGATHLLTVEQEAIRADLLGEEMTLESLLVGIDAGRKLQPRDAAG